MAVDSSSRGTRASLPHRCRIASKVGAVPFVRSIGSLTRISPLSLLSAGYMPPSSYRYSHLLDLLRAVQQAGLVSSR